MTRLVLLVALSVSACGTDAQVVHRPLEGQSLEQRKIEDARGPSQTVQDLMKFISSGEKKKADDLFSKSKRPARQGPQPQANNALAEVPPRLDWVGYLSEREWILKRILSEHIEGEAAVVEAELGVEDSERVAQKALFSLRREDGRWLIVDMEFAFDSPKPDVSGNAITR